MLLNWGFDMFDSLDLYIWVTCGCLGCAMGIYFGYWLRKLDEADGVVSALKAALDERRVPPSVIQQVVCRCDSILLLTWVRWKLQHNVRRGKGSADDFARCRSIASRIMLIKPLQ